MKQREIASEGRKEKLRDIPLFFKKQKRQSRQGGFKKDTKKV
jgi:hypothetical protein